MQHMKKSGVIFCILGLAGLLAVIVMAGDVTVQPDQIKVGDVECGKTNHVIQLLYLMV